MSLNFSEKLKLHGENGEKDSGGCSRIWIEWKAFEQSRSPRFSMATALL
jgi:hypothetical protein